MNNRYVRTFFRGMGMVPIIPLALGGVILAVAAGLTLRDMLPGGYNGPLAVVTAATPLPTDTPTPLPPTATSVPTTAVPASGASPTATPRDPTSAPLDPVQFTVTPATANLVCDDSAGHLVRVAITNTGTTNKAWVSTITTSGGDWSYTRASGTSNEAGDTLQPPGMTEYSVVGAVAPAGTTATITYNQVDATQTGAVIGTVTITCV